MKRNTSHFLFLTAAIFFCMAVFFVQKIRADEVDVDVSTSTKTIILRDSDGDGLLDADDPHPDTPEIYIVEDENRNGIVDSFEKPAGENKKQQTNEETTDKEQ